MRRRIFDLVVSAGGMGLVVALMAAGALLLWANSYTNDQVRSQLSMQQVYFPTADQMAQAKPGGEVTPGMLPFIRQYAGQQVLDGPQAAAYANHFIAVHLYDMPYHGVYAEVSTAARAATPGSAEAAKLTALQTTVFQGTTLRAMLLEAYAFSVFGEIAFVSALVSLSLAFVLAILAGMGLWHARRTPVDADLLQPLSGQPPVAA